MSKSVVIIPAEEVHKKTGENKTFVSMMEALGYDVRLVYEEREASK